MPHATRAGRWRWMCRARPSSVGAANEHAGSVRYAGCSPLRSAGDHVRTDPTTLQSCTRDELTGLGSGKSAAPASPAAARPPPSPPRLTLALRPRPETNSRVGFLAGIDEHAGVEDPRRVERRLGGDE